MGHERTEQRRMIELPKKRHSLEQWHINTLQRGDVEGQETQKDECETLHFAAKTTEVGREMRQKDGGKRADRRVGEAERASRWGRRGRRGLSAAPASQRPLWCSAGWILPWQHNRANCLTGEAHRDGEEWRTGGQMADWLRDERISGLQKDGNQESSPVLYFQCPLGCTTITIQPQSYFTIVWLKSIFWLANGCAT